MINIIKPNWRVPANIHAFTTTRACGNLATHIGGDVQQALRNRVKLRAELQLPSEPCWLQQEHTCKVVVADDYSDATQIPPIADASYTTSKNVVCAVLTADCVPILLCDRGGSVVAAVHAGWKGLADGIIEIALRQLAVNSMHIVAWLGPAISAAAFVVGTEVRDKFIAALPVANLAFTSYGADKWHADLYLLARQRLNAAGVAEIYGGNFCTFTDTAQFFSFRRESENAGRMAALIWME